MKHIFFLRHKKNEMFIHKKKTLTSLLPLLWKLLMYSIRPQNWMGRIRLKAPEGRPSRTQSTQDSCAAKTMLGNHAYYPVRESYSDASETRDLYPPIQITGDCQWTNGKSSRGSQEEGPPHMSYCTSELTQLEHGRQVDL